jgi:CRISPR-associated protein Cas5t
VYLASTTCLADDPTLATRQQGQPQQAAASPSGPAACLGAGARRSPGPAAAVAAAQGIADGAAAPAPAGAAGTALKTRAYDVYGQARAAPPPLPRAHLQVGQAPGPTWRPAPSRRPACVAAHCCSRLLAWRLSASPRPLNPHNPSTQDGAPAQPNLPHLSREAPARRTANTSSAMLMRSAGRGGRQIGLSPGHVHFGSVAAGATARPVRCLGTFGVPPPSAAGSPSCAGMLAVPRPARPQLACAPRRVVSKPGPLAAGMEAALQLEFSPEQPGDWVGEVRLGGHACAFQSALTAACRASRPAARIDLLHPRGPAARQVTVKGDLEVATLTVSAKVTPAPAVLPAAVPPEAADGEGAEGGDAGQQAA